MPSKHIETGEPGSVRGCGKVGLKPEPQCTTKMTFDQLAQWIDDVRAGDWSWLRNSRCKYVEIGIDTRSGCYSVKDRDGNRITPDELFWQTGLSPTINTKGSSDVLLPKI